MTFLIARVGLSTSIEGWVHRAISPDGRIETPEDDIDISVRSTRSVDVASVLATLILSLKTWSLAPGIPPHPSCISPTPSCFSSASDETYVDNEDEAGMGSFAKMTPAEYLSGNSAPNQGCGCMSEPASNYDCYWKEQATNAHAEASKDRARNGTLVHDLRRQLVRSEEEAESLRHKLHGLEAEGGLKDIYIHTLLTIKEEAEVQRPASQRTLVARLQDTLGEREAEIIDQQAENIALRKVIKEWEGRYTSMKSQMESEVAGLRGRLANLGHESRVKGARVLTLTQEKRQLEELCSSMKRTIVENEESILRLKGRLGERGPDPGWNLDLHIHSLSGVQKHYHDPQYQSVQSVQNAIWEKDQQIADLNDRLTEYHRALAQLTNGGVNSILRSYYGRQWEATTAPPGGGLPLRPGTTPV